MVDRSASAHCHIISVSKTAKVAFYVSYVFCDSILQLVILFILVIFFLNLYFLVFMLIIVYASVLNGSSCLSMELHAHHFSVSQSHRMPLADLEDDFICSH